MGNEQTAEKVVEFVQSETKTKTFRLDYPVSEELRDVMVTEVFRDFMIYATDLYYAEYFPTLKEYVDEHEPKMEKRETLVKNLFWWRILFESSMNLKESCIEDYISENYPSLRKRTFMISWLKECGKAFPKFYYVGYKYNDRVLVLIDILEEKPLDVIVCDPFAISPKKGEIVMGTLLPLGDGLHFPINDFYHFDFEAREAIAACLHHYYDKYLKNSTIQEAFIHVLSAMLQIERMVFLKNHENTSNKNIKKKQSKNGEGQKHKLLDVF
jgi:hypothetical protein